jgi:hypothetical protein
MLEYFGRFNLEKTGVLADPNIADDEFDEPYGEENSGR